MMLSGYDKAIVFRNQQKGFSTWQYQTPEGYWCSADTDYAVYLLVNNIAKVRLI